MDAGCLGLSTDRQAEAGQKTRINGFECICHLVQRHRHPNLLKLDDDDDLIAVGCRPRREREILGPLCTTRRGWPRRRRRKKRISALRTFSQTLIHFPCSYSYSFFFFSAMPRSKEPPLRKRPHPANPSPFTQTTFITRVRTPSD